MEMSCMGISISTSEVDDFDRTIFASQSQGKAV